MRFTGARVAVGHCASRQTAAESSISAKSTVRLCLNFRCGPPLKVACCPGLFVRYRRPLSGHAGLVPGNPRPRNTGSEHPTKFEPPTTPATHPRRRLAKRTTSASQQQVNTEFRPGSSGLVLPNLCGNGHVVFTCSTQNRMTFPGIPPTAPSDGVGGKALHTRRSKVLDSKRLLGGVHI